MKNILIMMACLFALPASFFVGGPSFAAVHTTPQQSPEDAALFTYRSNVLKILSVLDNRIADRPLLVEKVKDKVFSLSNRQIQLIASLSDHMIKEKNSISGDITFLLLTALIVFL